MVNECLVRHSAGVMYLLCLALLVIDHVRYVRHSCDHTHVELTVKALLYKYDAGKLSGVKPEDYPALMEEAQKL